VILARAAGLRKGKVRDRVQDHLAHCRPSRG
jgi:hypothetical protein